MTRLILFAMAAFISSSAHADFFTVSEDKPLTESRFENPQNLLMDSLHEIANEWESLKTFSYSLLKFSSHAGDYGQVVEKYNRAKHFGSWIRDRVNGRCVNTRGLVLERDSTHSVSYSADGCRVERGQWDDPYTSRTYTDASDIQIDHFVPLKNAYISGASDWTSKKRCLYANFMGNQFHLLSVLGQENMRKSDKSPDGYMPPNRAYSCQYLNQWLKVKMIWALNLSNVETRRISELVKENRCDLGSFMMADRDLQEQRRFIADNANLCQ